MNTDQARKIIHAFIADERFWRNKVFASNPDKRAFKLRECDRALEALAVLAPEPETVEQPGLFECHQ